MRKISNFAIALLISLILIVPVTVFNLGHAQSPLQALSNLGNDVNLYDDPGEQYESTIAVNPTNPLNLAAGSYDAGTAKPLGTLWWTITYRSLDGGMSWNHSYVPRAGPIASFTKAGNPVVDFDGFGQAFYAGIAYEPTGGNVDASVWVARSIDGGLTYDTPVMVAKGFGGVGIPWFRINDKPWIAVDKRTSGTGAGYVYVTWTKIYDDEGNGSETCHAIMFSRSTDSGATFSRPIEVTDYSLSQFSQVAVGPGGEIYVSWVELYPLAESASLYFDKSTDYGASFGDDDIYVLTFDLIPDPLKYIARTPSTISMAVDTVSKGAYKGRIYIAYPVNPAGNDLSDIMLIHSLPPKNDGSRWSAPIRLNDDTTLNDQFFPAVTVDPLGHIKVAWYDRRLSVSNKLIDVFMTESEDGGESFTNNVRVTDTSFNPEVYTDHITYYAFLGDYIDIDASAQWTYPIWTDRRNRNDDIYVDAPI